jgi:hypothetical protein
MSLNKSNILTIFNNHFIEFIEDIVRIFPNNIDLVTLKNFFVLIRKTNPKIIITVFYKYVVLKYQTYIDNGNINYFIEKDYQDDLTSNNNSDKIIEAINGLREPIQLMDEKNKLNTIKYLQNLCKLSSSYNID